MQNALTSATMHARNVIRNMPWGTVARVCLMTATVVIVSTVSIYAAGTASGAAVPWEGALEGIIGIFTGRTARYIAALMFVGGALLWGFSRNEDGMSTIGKVILSVGLIIGSLSITDLLFTAVV